MKKKNVLFMFLLLGGGWIEWNVAIFYKKNSKISKKKTFNRIYLFLFQFYNFLH